MFKRYYEDELEFLREMGAEFSSAYPDIAAELGLGSHDPDIERMLQGFAFLTARIRETLDGEFPELLYPLLSQLWPHVLRPSPAIGIIEFRPQPGVFQEVYHLKRGAAIQSIPIDGTSCQFRTSYDLHILPWTIDEVRIDAPSTTRHELRLKLVPLPGASLRRMEDIPLRLHFHGSVRQTYGLHVWLRRDLLNIRVKAMGPEGELLGERLLPANQLKAVGWDHEDVLLPYPPYSFRGFRHLHEYFLFPQKYLFADLRGLDWLSEIQDLQELQITFELNALKEPLAVSKENIRLHCVPAINLFPHPARTIRVEATRSEYLLLAEGPRPEHFDIFSLDRVMAYNRRRGKNVQYHPFYSFYRPPADVGDRPILYQVHLRPSVGRRQSGELDSQSSYPGVDSYISFVEPSGEPASPPTAVSIDMLVTNRDLPRRLRPGDVNVPTTDIPSLVSFSNLGGFSVPTPAPVGKDGLWRYFAHLSLGWNYLADRESLGALLSLYDFPAFHDQRSRQSLELLLASIVGVETTPEHRLIGRPPALVRGTHIQLKVHEARFAHQGELYLFGTALSHFLGEVSTLNTYSRLSILGVDSGLEWSWEPRVGRQAML